MVFFQFFDLFLSFSPDFLSFSNCYLLGFDLHPEHSFVCFVVPASYQLFGVHLCIPDPFLRFISFFLNKRESICLNLLDTVNFPVSHSGSSSRGVII